MINKLIILSWINNLKHCCCWVTFYIRSHLINFIKKNYRI